MFRPQFSLRWLLIAMISAALLFGGYELRRRSLRYSAMAQQYAAMEKALLDRTYDGPIYRSSDGVNQFIAAEDMIAEYRAARKRYERAAAYPWRPLEDIRNSRMARWLPMPSY